MLRRTLFLTLLIAIAGAAALAGCGSDDENTAASTPVTATTETRAATTRTADTTAKAKTTKAKTTSTSSRTPKPATVKKVTPKKPTQKPSSLSAVRKREAVLKRARAACRADRKLETSNGFSCVLLRAEDRTFRRKRSVRTGTQLPDCPQGERTLNGEPCRPAK